MGILRKPSGIRKNVRVHTNTRTENCEELKVGRGHLEAIKKQPRDDNGAQKQRWRGRQKNSSKPRGNCFLLRGLTVATIVARSGNHITEMNGFQKKNRLPSASTQCGVKPSLQSNLPKTWVIDLPIAACSEITLSPTRTLSFGAGLYSYSWPAGSFVVAPYFGYDHWNFLLRNI